MPFPAALSPIQTERINMKKTLKIITLCLAAVICMMTFASCAPRAIMTLGEKSISVNIYEFLLSRMKGTLGYYGYDITSDTFWLTVETSDGMTRDDYFCEEIKRETAYYLIADKLFDDYGLTLGADEEKKIDDLLATHEKKAGSRAALNEKLKAFGVNYDILRQIYVIESKIAALKLHLYGENASKVADDIKHKYLDDNYVCFDQIFIATYYYLTDLDRFDDTVYYTDKNHTAIAYDKVNGKTQINEMGIVATDIFGNAEYYTAEGRIAYDKQNGVIGYVYEKDANGKFTENRVIENYDSEKKGQLYETAKEYASVCHQNPERFAEYLKLYGDADTSDTVYLFASPSYYASLNSGAAYFDKIAEELSGMSAGDCKVVTSNYGYHVVFKRENAKGAYDDAELKKTYFTDFSDNVIEYLWSELCQSNMPSVTVDKETADQAPNMREVNANITY